MADIVYLSKVDATARTQTGDTDLHEITDYTITFEDLEAAGFGAGDDVMIFVKFGTKSSSGFGERQKGDIGHGTTFAGRTVWTDGDWVNYRGTGWNTEMGVQWMKRHTLVDAEDIYFSQGNTSAGATQSCDDFSCFILRLDDLVENTDFFHDSTTDSGNAPAAYDTNGATFTLPSGGDDWAIWNFQKWKIDVTNDWMSMGTDVDSTVYQEIKFADANANTDGRILRCTMHYEAALGSAVDVYSVYKSSTQTNDLLATELFALRLGAFAAHNGVRSTSNVTLATVDTYVEATGVAAHVHAGGGLAIFASTCSAVTSEAKRPYGRFQIGGTDWPASGFGRCCISQEQGSNEQLFYHFGEATVAAATLDIDFDLAEEVDDDPDLVFDETCLVVFSMALGGAGAVPILIQEYHA